MEYEKDALELQCEIKELKEEIKCAKNINRKNSVIKNLKIFSGGLRAIYPYIITGGIVFSSFSFLESTPHYKDNIEANSLKIIDSNGISKYIYFEDSDFNEKSNVIKKYSKWNKSDDGTYIRKVESYIIPSDFPEEKVNDIISNNNKKIFDSLEIKSEGYEESLYLSKEELFKNNPYIEAYLYDDENYKSFIKESDKDNKYNTISFYVLLVMFSSFIPIPGGAGVAEGSFFLLFQLFFPSPILPTAVLCWRVITFYIPVCLGGIMTVLPNQKNDYRKMKVETGI